jgi:excisionase family DNA binding protein
MDKRGFTVRDGADYLGISQSSVRTAIRENKLPVRRHGTTILIDRADLDAYFENLPAEVSS